MEERLLIQVAQRVRHPIHPSSPTLTTSRMGRRRSYKSPGDPKSGKLRSADTTAVIQVLWPHELGFTPQGRPAIYESLSAMGFVNGYLSIMSLQTYSLRDKKAMHLQEMREDGETFRRPVVRAYHTVWLQHLEQGRATWDDEVTRLKLQRALLWHRIAYPTKPQPNAAISTNKPKAPSQAPRHIGPFSDPAQLGNRACVTYNQGLCFSKSAHPLHFTCAVFASTQCRCSVTT